MACVRSWLRAILARLHRAIGATWFHLGAPERAQRHMERVLELKGDDFAAYVYLGRLAYSRGDYAGWRRECEHARRTSPERFAKLRHPFELHRSRSSGTVFEDTGERASWRVYRISRVSSPPPGTGSQLSRLTERRRPATDDFVSDAERRRFRELSPLRIEDVRKADLDDLARRLCE